jgi:hypothetical protein
MYVVLVMRDWDSPILTPEIKNKLIGWVDW